MFSVFGLEGGRVLCCQGSQCGDYLDLWPSVTTTVISHHGEAQHQAGQMEATGLQQQQDVVKYPPCQQSNVAITHRMATTAIIVITLLYF